MLKDEGSATRHLDNHSKFSAKANHVNTGGVLASLHHHERYSAEYRSLAHEL